jgi:sphinganine C4-monooxygenase
VNLVLGETGENTRVKALVLHELGYYVYWWVIPAMQFLMSMYVLCASFHSDY